MGMSLSFIFLIYTLGSIYLTFAIAAGMFGIMAVAGYTTKTDLTKFGSLMIMGLIGIIIASVVNYFMKSGTMDYIISFLGVLIFTVIQLSCDNATIKNNNFVHIIIFHLYFVSIFPPYVIFIFSASCLLFVPIRI